MGSLFPADAAADEAGAGKELRTLLRPAIRDGVSEQDHAGSGGSGELGVVLGVSARIGRILLGGGAHGEQQAHKQE